MVKAKAGDLVKVHYTGTLDDGTMFDTSEGKQPLEFVLGAGRVISGFDKAVTGLKLNETKKVTIPFDQAYGPYHDDKIIEVGVEKFGPEFKAKVGQMIYVNLDNKKQVPVTVVSINKKKIKLDTNHPMAGKNLTFEIRLVEAGPVPEGCGQGCSCCSGEHKEKTKSKKPCKGC